MFIGVDLGTSETKAVLVDRSGQVLSEASAPNTLLVPLAGYAEHDALKDWWGNCCTVIRNLLEASKVNPVRIEAVACSGIGPCVLPVDNENNPLRPGMLYGIDTRASQQINYLNQLFGEEQILKRTGNALTSQSAGPKVAWLRDNEPDVFHSAEKFHTSQSFLVARLTGEHIIDHLTAAYWGPFYDIRQTCWNTEWVEQVVEVNRLPHLGWPGEIAGFVSPGAALETGLKQGTPVLVGTADAPAEAVSAGVLAPGDLMIMYGSSIFMIAVVRETMVDPRMWAAPFVFPGTAIVAGGTSTAGTLTRWLIGLLIQETDHASISAHYSDFTDWAAASPPGAGGLNILPYFSGERTPIHDPDARGLIFGLTLKHTHSDICRAALEGIAQGIRQNVEIMTEMGIQIERIQAVGGGVQNRVWLQTVTDCLGRPQNVIARRGAAYGGAILAAIAVGALNRGDVGSWLRVDETVQPDKTLAGLYSRQASQHRRLYEATKSLMHEVSNGS